MERKCKIRILESDTATAGAALGDIKLSQLFLQLHRATKEKKVLSQRSDWRILVAGDFWDHLTSADFTDQLWNEQGVHSVTILSFSHF